jgi:hypothetical protein
VTSPTFDEILLSLSWRFADEVDLSAPFTTLFPVDDASVATLGALLGTETISATSERAARLDELQFDLGEGPCWDAMASANPVISPRLDAEAHRWPVFVKEIQSHDVVSLFAFPLRLGPLQIGAIDLYSSRTIALAPADSERASRLADQIARRVLWRALASGRSDGASSLRPHARRIIHQATGMVVAQLDVSAEDAELVIQGHAFAESASMMDVARRIVDRELVFDDRPPRGDDDLPQDGGPT